MRYTTTDGPSKALNAIQDGSLGDKMGNAGKPSKEHVLNLLGRLTEEPPPKPIPIPKGLRLTLEPQANVNRYDSLRRAHDAA